MPACGVELLGESEGLGLPRGAWGWWDRICLLGNAEYQTGRVRSSSHVIPELGQGVLVAEIRSRVPRREGGDA